MKFIGLSFVFHPLSDDFRIDGFCNGDNLGDQRRAHRGVFHFKHEGLVDFEKIGRRSTDTPQIGIPSTKIVDRYEVSGVLETVDLCQCFATKTMLCHLYVDTKVVGTKTRTTRLQMLVYYLEIQIIREEVERHLEAFVDDTVQVTSQLFQCLGRYGMV